MTQPLTIYAVSLAYVDDDGNLSSETIKLCTTLEEAKNEVARLHSQAIKGMSEEDMELSYDSYEDGDQYYELTCVDACYDYTWSQTVQITELTLEA